VIADFATPVLESSRVLTYFWSSLTPGVRGRRRFEALHWPRVWERQVMAMSRFRIAGAVAGFLAACVAVSVQGAEWCVHDPALTIRTSATQSFTVYVTEGVMGTQYQAELASARTSYRTVVASRKTILVSVYDFIPSDASGSFATELIVSSKPFGSGQVYGSVYGRSDTTMTIWFWINPQSLGG
jgi:hypothetical protein